MRERLDGRDRRAARHRSDRNPPPQSHCRGRDALCSSSRYARHGNDLRFRRLCRAARQGAGARSAGKNCAKISSAGAPAAKRSARVSPCSSRKAGLGLTTCVRASIDTGGTVEIVTGATSVGQGMETVIAQICADALGVDYRRVRVVHGQTDRIAYGMGTFASRVTVMTGEATRIAAAKLRAKAIAAAAGLLQTRRPSARRDRRQGGAQKRRSRTVDLARRRRARAQSRLKTSRRSDAGTYSPKVCSSSSI